MLPMPPSFHTDLFWDPAWPRLRLFGPMTASWAADRSFLPSNRKTRAVLAVLALAGGAPVARKRLIDLLWHTRGHGQAQASLRQSLHELRGCLAPLRGAGVQSAGDRLTLRIEHIWIDALFVQTPGFSVRDAMDVFRGPLLSELEGLSDTLDAWIVSERKTLYEKIRQKLDGFLAGEPGDDTTAKIAETVLSFDASHEAAWRTLAGYHASVGKVPTRDGRPSFDVTTSLARFAPCGQQHTHGVLPIANSLLPSARLGRLRGEGRFEMRWRAAHLAVRPTRALGDATPDFASCIDWQIQTALCKFEDLSCTPVGCAADGDGTPQHLAQDGFDFLLEGCIDRRADQDQFIVRLRDLQVNGVIFWSQRICRAASGAGLFGADFAGHLAPQIAAEIFRHQAVLLDNCPGLELHDCELILKASRSVEMLDRQRISEADTLLSRAIKQDKHHAALFAWSAYIQLMQVGQGWASEVETTQRRIGELTDRALSLKPETASVLSIAGHVLAFNQNRLEEGLSLQEKALCKNPNLPSAWLFSGLAHTYAGEHTEAISRLQHAKQLSPADQQGYFIDMGLSLSYLLDGDTGGALGACRSAIRLNPNFSSSFKVGVSASGYTDRGRDESRLLQRLLVLEPALTVERVLSRTPLTRRADQSRLSDGLRLAGLPR